MYFGKKVVGVDESRDRVSAVFEDGTSAEGDLLVGCDGLHSAVRNALFGKEDPRYMGLVQVRPKKFQNSSYSEKKQYNIYYHHSDWRILPDPRVPPQ